MHSMLSRRYLPLVSYLRSPQHIKSVTEALIKVLALSNNVSAMLVLSIFQGLLELGMHAYSYMCSVLSRVCIHSYIPAYSYILITFTFYHMQFIIVEAHVYIIPFYFLMQLYSNLRTLPSCPPL